MADTRVIHILDSLGISYEDRSPKANWSWDGKSIAIKNKDTSIIHDVAHWLVAPKERRSVPDFGLGKADESSLEAPLLVIDSMDEELKASLLGILIEFHHGMDWLATFDAHNWIESQYDADSDETNSRLLPNDHRKDIESYVQEWQNLGIFELAILKGCDFLSSPVIKYLFEGWRAPMSKLYEIAGRD